MRKLTEFGLAVKTELLHRGETQAWLRGKVNEDTGLYLDTSYLNRILVGKSNPPKIIESITKILEL